MYRSFLKRSLDVILASLFLLLWSPVLLVAALILLLANKGRVFFLQERPGLYEKPFIIVKFKTMNDKRNALTGDFLPDEKRLTKIGKLLRLLSIDELPQLINVIKGDMSLIGPRPLLMEYLPLYDSRQRLRHSVKPGITGWAQVNGRNAVNWEERLEMDVWYSQNLAFPLDIKILWLTVVNVIVPDFKKIKTIDDHSTLSEKFTGTSLTDKVLPIQRQPVSRQVS